MNTLKGQEVFAVGKWNGMTFQLHDLRAMVDAFAKLKGAHKPPLKLGHNDKQPLLDGQHAIGWVSNLYIKGDKLLADFENVPDIVVNAIKNKLYRTVSIELMMDVKYKGELIPFVVDAVALLGADLPAVGTLKDLEAYMSRTAAEFSGGRRGAFSAVAGIINEEKKMEKHEIEKLVADAVAPLAAKFAASEQRNTALENENTALKQQVATFTKERDSVEIATKRTRISAVLEGLTASGIIQPAQREAFTKVLGVDDDAKVKTIDVDGFIAAFNVVETKSADGKVAFKTKSAGDTDKPTEKRTFAQASDEVDARTKKYAAEKGVSYSDAKVAVLQADPVLATEYAQLPPPHTA